MQFCKQHDILIQGRGSAANSAVCYALEITAIDPVGMELLFERFLSESRGEGRTLTSICRLKTNASGRARGGKSVGFDQESLQRLSGLVNHFEWRGPTDTRAHSYQNAGFDLKHPPIPNAARRSDPMTVPNDPTKTPEMGTRKILTPQ